MDPTLENIVIAITVGVPVGILTGILVKIYAKSKQELIYEKNRKIIIQMMLSEIYVPFYQLSDIYALFARQQGFDSSKSFSHEFSDNEYAAIIHYANDIQKRLNKFPKFRDCSTFVAFNEYLAIKKYIMSAIFFYFIDGSAVGMKNIAAYEPKIMIDHALFAKEVIDYFQNYGLASEFIRSWTTVLSDEGMLQPNYTKKPLVPGDIVQHYAFDSELLQ